MFKNVSLCYLKNLDGKKIPISNARDWVQAQHTTMSWNATEVRYNSFAFDNYVKKLWLKGLEVLQKQNKNFVITLNDKGRNWQGFRTYNYVKKPIAKFKKIVCYVPLVKKKLKGSSKKYHPTSYLNKFILDQDKNFISKEVV